VVQFVMVAVGVGTSCGAPKAILAFAGESDGKDDAIGTGAFGRLMASRSETADGVGAGIGTGAFGRLMASRSETAEGVGAGPLGEVAGSAGVCSDGTAEVVGCVGA
jgi:hypothetical protein